MNVCVNVRTFCRGRWCSFIVFVAVNAQPPYSLYIFFCMCCCLLDVYYTIIDITRETLFGLLLLMFRLPSLMLPSQVCGLFRQIDRRTDRQIDTRGSSSSIFSFENVRNIFVIDLNKVQITRRRCRQQHFTLRLCIYTHI